MSGLGLERVSIENLRFGASVLGLRSLKRKLGGLYPEMLGLRLLKCRRLVTA